MPRYICKVSVCFVLGVVFVLGTGKTANADIINIFADTANSEWGLGDFTGTLQYEYKMGDLGLLTVVLNNTSDEANFGWITGFIFNYSTSDKASTAALTSATHPFEDAPGQNGMPYGNPFMAGAALGGDWQGGGAGNPELGIGVGDTGTFSFDITATDADLLSAGSFLQGPYDFNFIVRFLGFKDKESDKVPAVPAPGALALLGLGALAHRRRRR